MKVTATDASGAAIANEFQLTVVNSNDAPQAGADSLTLAQGSITANLVATLLANDADLDVGDSLRVASVKTTGTLGTVAFDAMTQTLIYTADAATQVALGAGVSATDMFDYTVADSAGAASMATVRVTVTGVNDAPTNVTLSAATVTENTPDTMVGSLSATDADAGETFIYSIVPGADAAQFAIEGSTLKVGAMGLDFEAGATRRVTVRATDQGGLSFDEIFAINVTNVNEAPIVAIPILDQIATQDIDFSFRIPDDNFADVDAVDVLAYSIPPGVVLPGWLSFDPDSRTFSGTPANEDVGTATITVRATDSGGLVVTDTFLLTIENVNDAPYVYAAHVPVFIQEGALYQDSVSGTFLDPDVSDILTYRAEREDGSPLPGWLTLDATTGHISGTPSEADLGFWSIKVTATDQGGLSAFTFLEVTVAPWPDLVLTGTAGPDTLTGRSGNDTLNGLGGADTMIGRYGNDSYYVDNGGDVVTELANQGDDTVLSSITYMLSANVENLTLTGTGKVNGAGNALDNRLIGNSNTNTLTGGQGDDTLDGGAGGDRMIGGVGNDTYLVDNTGDKVFEITNEGIDSVLSSITFTLGANLENLALISLTVINGTGNALNNLLLGNAVANTLTGGSGNDILQGLDGNDTLKNASGNSLFDGGAGADTMTGHIGNEMFIGGIGNDTLTNGSGADIIAFNAGDGQDVINASAGADNTLSLGGGIRYEELAFSRVRNDLVLKTGGADQMTFKDWYARKGNPSVANLQVVAQAMAGFNPLGGDPLLDNKVEQFNFAALAYAFDAGGQVNGWALTNALLSAHLAGSDTEAIGGDLAYQYGLNRSLAGIGLTPAQDVLNAPGFGAAPQQLRPLQDLQQGQIKLS